MQDRVSKIQKQKYEKGRKKPTKLAVMYYIKPVLPSIDVQFPLITYPTVTPGGWLPRQNLIINWVLYFIAFFLTVAAP